MPKMVDVTIELSDGTEMDVNVPDNWTDTEISQWATAQLGKSTKKPERPKKAGTAGSFVKGFSRGGGRISAGAKDIGTFASHDPFGQQSRTERESIAASEAGKENIFREATSEHPVAAFLGEAVLPTLLSGGRTPFASLLRGGATGALSYNEDPTLRGMQTALGAAGGLVGNKLAQNVKPIGRQAQALGLRATPEETGVTLLPKDSVSGLQSFRTEAFKNAKFNQAQITRESLKELGERGDRFTLDTLPNVKARASELFDKALGSKDNVYVSPDKLDALNSFKIEQKVSGIGRKAASRWANDIDDHIWNNNGILSVKKYHQFRSDITDEIISSTKGKKKRVLGELIDWLDTEVGSKLSPETQKTFNEARKLWKNYSMIKTLAKRDGIDSETGLLNPVKLNRILTNKDEAGYLLGGNKSNVYNMLRINQKISGHKDITAGASNNLGSLRIGMSGGTPSLGYYSNRLINEPLGAGLLSINRLPGDLLTDAPAGVVPPLMNLLGNE